MSYEEKGTWVYLVTSAAAYAVYLVIIVGRLQSTPVAAVSYAPVLLWTTLASIAASVAGRTLVETASPSDSRRKDVRDKEVYRFGEYASRWLIVAGAAAGFFGQTIIAIEQGRYSPSLEMAFQIARVFRVPLDEVFQYPDGEGEPR